MPITPDALFGTVPKEDFLNLFDGSKPRYKDVVDSLDFQTKDVSNVTGVAISSVRYDEKIPKDVSDRIREWAILLNLVAGFFKGDRDKTNLWLTMPNPLLGNVSPRDMIRIGRFRKLHRFVIQALGEN